MKFPGYKDFKKNRAQLLKEHLIGVSRLAENFAS